jgi:protease-4
MQSQAEKIYFNDFLPKVSTGRKKTVEEVNTLGQGRVWTGVQAKENGLIDEFGGLERAIAIAKELAGLPADKDVRRVEFPRGGSMLDDFFGSSDAAAETDEVKAKRAFSQSLPEDVRRSLKYAELLDRMSNGEAMLMLPFELQIK